MTKLVLQLKRREGVTQESELKYRYSLLPTSEVIALQATASDEASFDKVLEVMMKAKIEIEVDGNYHLADKDLLLQLPLPDALEMQKAVLGNLEKKS